MQDGKPVSSDLIVTFLLGNAYRKAVKEREAEEAIRTGGVLPKVIDKGILNGKAVSLTRPKYPEIAKRQGLRGSASVEILIDEHGNVILAGAVGGHPLLQTDARNAACGAKFTPTSLKGQPVKVTGVITYNFVP